MEEFLEEVKQAGLIDKLSPEQITNLYHESKLFDHIEFVDKATDYIKKNITKSPKDGKIEIVCEFTENEFNDYCKFLNRFSLKTALKIADLVEDTIYRTFDNLGFSIEDIWE